MLIGILVTYIVLLGLFLFGFLASLSSVQYFIKPEVLTIHCGRYINTSRVNTINYSLFVCDKASDCLLYEETA